MSSISKKLDEYLSDADKTSLENDYKFHDHLIEDISMDAKNQIIGSFFTHLQNVLLHTFNVYPQQINMIGNGSMGVVIGFESDRMLQGLESLEKLARRVNFSKTTTIPNKIALKVQLIAVENSYQEKRMLREEHIMSYLTNINASNNSIKTTIKSAIPEFYFGCTIKFYNVFFRLTFMELLDPEHFITLEKLIINKRHLVTDNIIDKIENVITSLWRLKVTHNDLSVRNILVGISENNKDTIKLIDFGLSQMFSNTSISNSTNISDLKKLYSNVFRNESNEEQHGSNVAKLVELCKTIKTVQGKNVNTC